MSFRDPCPDCQETTRAAEVSQGPVGTPVGPSGFHLIATLHFDSLAAVQAAFAVLAGLWLLLPKPM